MTKFCSLFLFANFMVNVGLQAEVQAQVKVTGTTTALIDRDSMGSPLSKVAYVPLEGAEVVAFRSTPNSGDHSDQNGKFGFDVDPGRPFTVLFRDPSNRDIVPELQQLSGQDGLLNDVHVTLLTVKQYDEIYGREALVVRLRYIQEVMRKVEGEKFGESLNFVERLLKRVGG